MVAAWDGPIFPEDGVHDDDCISASDDGNDQERRVTVWGGSVQLEGILSLPVGAHPLVVIAYNRMGNAEHLLVDLNDLADASRAASCSSQVGMHSSAVMALVSQTRGFLNSFPGRLA